MNWISLIPTFLSIAEELPALITAVSKAWQTAPVNGMAAVTKVIQGSPALPALAKLGAQLFPKLSPEIHAAAAALVVAHTNNTAWVQSAINLIASTGYIALAKPLVVDGQYGQMTFAAVEAIQAKLGLPVSGFVADAEYNAISMILAKLG